MLSLGLAVTMCAKVVAPGLFDVWAGSANQSPSSLDIHGLADAAHMSADGRRIFLDTRPQIVDVQQVADLCERPLSVDAAEKDAESFEIGGCYRGDGTGRGTIVLAAPADPWLDDGLVTVAAHEMLHAAWDRMGLLEKEELVPLLEAEVATIDAADPVHEQIAWSVDGYEPSRPTELFAYLGTQVWRDGGLDPRLEEVYARFISDRARLVDVYTDQAFG